jgi:hypothetical protein
VLSAGGTIITEGHTCTSKTDANWSLANLITIVAQSQPIEKQVYFGYLDFFRLHTLHQAGAYFVIRARKHPRFVR